MHCYVHKTLTVESKYFITTNFVSCALSNIIQIVINFRDTQLTILSLKKERIRYNHRFRATQLIIFIKKSEIIHRCSFDSNLSTYRILRSNSLYLSYNKKEKFLAYL
jgi:hypothetical protein